MFNSTPERVAPQAWAPDTVLQTVRQGDTGFANTDWDDVPRLDYRTEKFRQLAVPDAARVVEDASEFQSWQPRQLGDDAFGLSKPTAQPASVNTGSQGRESAQAPAKRQGVDSALNTALDSSEGSSQVTPTETEDSPNAQARTASPAATDHSAQAQTADAVNPAGTPDDGETSGSTDPAAEADGAANTTDPQASNALRAADAAAAPEDIHSPALDSAAVQEACDAARQEGLEQGRAEGLAEGREQALDEARQEREAALEQAATDKAQALQQLREELEAEIDPLKRQLNKAAEKVQSLVGQPEKLFEHIKRLSLHLAEQLVLGELNLSSAAIERLIQRCLDELNLHGNHVVTVELNPQDKARLQEHSGEMSRALSVQAVASLQPGSVRVMINDTQVEDLVGNRLEALARSLLVQPEVWREQSPFFRQPLAQRESEVQDAPARAVSSREHSSTTPDQNREDDRVAVRPTEQDNDGLLAESIEPPLESSSLQTEEFPKTPDSSEDHHD